jgi:hypothetical protein
MSFQMHLIDLQGALSSLYFYKLLYQIQPQPEHHENNTCALVRVPSKQEYNGLKEVFYEDTN